MEKYTKIKLKIISQSFYPDIVATGELLFELALKLSNDYDVDVQVVTAQPTFVKKNKLPDNEIIEGIKIKRLTIFNFDKNSLKGKIFNAHSFFYSVMHHLNWAKKVNWLLIPTSPPLLPLMGTYVKLLKGQKYIYLMHDIYPEIAVKLDYIKNKSLIYKLWDYLSKISLKKADKIIVLSDDMKEKIIEWVKEIDKNKIYVIHNWANEAVMKIIPKEDNHFLNKFNLINKFIIEYSGNLGRIHEFKTFIDVAIKLKDEKDILFLFIGEGGKKPDVEKMVNDYQLENVMFLPYQEREDLSYSLGMADIHILSLQESYEKLAAPSKLYGILASGKPVIYVGPRECFITKILEDNECGYQVDIADDTKFCELILNIKDSKTKAQILGNNSRKAFELQFTLNEAVTQYYDLIK